MPRSKDANSSPHASSRKSKPQSPKATFKYCPESGDKVWFVTCTLKDMKSAEKTGQIPFAAKYKKQLVRIPSKSERERLYEQAAQAIAYKEDMALPKYGGRYWSCTVTLSEPSNRKPPLFRWYRGRLELAVLPHLLEKTPDSYILDEDEQGDLVKCTDLSERTESLLTRMAWIYCSDEYAIPNISLRWLSPLHQTWKSRKAVVEEAQRLQQQEVVINKTLWGIGKRGQVLRPSQCTRDAALQAGKFRFLRDGLWVVGQEDAWQEQRAEQIEQELEQTRIKRQKLEEQQETATEQSNNNNKPNSPLALFLYVHRDHHKQRRLRELQQSGMETNTDTKTKIKFTLRQADAELRVIWKTSLNKYDRQQWKDLLQHGKLETTAMDKSKESASTVGVLPMVSSSSSPCEIPAITNEPATDGKIAEETTPSSNLLKEENNPIVCFESNPVAILTNHIPTDMALVEEKKDDEEEEHLSKLSKECVHNGTAVVVGSPVETTYDSFRVNNQATKVLAFKTHQHERLCPETKVIPGSVEKIDAGTAVVTPGDSEEEDINARKEEPKQGAMEQMVQQKEGGQREQQPAEEDGDIKVDIPEPTANGRRSLRTRGKKLGLENAMALKEKNNAVVQDFSHSRPKRKKRAAKLSSVAKPVPLLQGPSNNEYAKPPSVLPPFTRQPEKRKREMQPPRRFTPSTHWRLNPHQVQLCYDAAIEHYDKVMNTVKARALHAELQDGFDVLRERGRGRYDMELPAFDQPVFDFFTDLAKAPWMQVVHQILGPDVSLIHKGVFLSMPGAVAQNYHQDGPHLTTQYQRPCHAINVFVPLVDLTIRNGPTEFVLGSHILGYEGYRKADSYIPEVKSGTPVIFDYRLGHLGMANNSNTCRPILYCTYADNSNGKAFKDSVNFSRKRYHRIGDLVEKPLSREERTRQRKTAQEERACLKAVEEYISKQKEEPTSAKHTGNGAEAATAVQVSQTLPQPVEPADAAVGI